MLGRDLIALLERDGEDATGYGRGELDITDANDHTSQPAQKLDQHMLSDIGSLRGCPERRSATRPRKQALFRLADIGDVMNHNPGDLARHHLLGVSVDAFTIVQAVKQCTDAIEQGRYLSIGMVNAAKIVAMQRDKQLSQAVGGCRMILADGQSVVWPAGSSGSHYPSA